MTRRRTANLLSALADAVSKVLETRVGTHHNETDTAAAALNLLASHEGCTNTALSRALELSHPATVRLVDRLVSGRLVARRSSADGRTVALSLTPAGRERARAILRQRELALKDVVELLSPEHMLQLDSIAETLLGVLTASPAKAAHICRLCDDVACPPDQCPVHPRAHSLSPAV